MILGDTRLFFHETVPPSQLLHPIPRSPNPSLRHWNVLIVLKRDAASVSSQGQASSTPFILSPNGTRGATALKVKGSPPRVQPEPPGGPREGTGRRRTQGSLPLPERRPSRCRPRRPQEAGPLLTPPCPSTWPPGGCVRARASRLCRRVTWPAPCAEAARRPGQMSPSPRPHGSCSQGCVSGRFRHFTGSFWFLASPWLCPRPGLLNLLPTGGCGATWTVSRHTHQEVRLGQGHQGDQLHAGTSKHPFWKRFPVFIPPPAPETEAQLPGSAGRPPSTHPSASRQSGQLCALHPSSRTK